MTVEFGLFDNSLVAIVGLVRIAVGTIVIVQISLASASESFRAFLSIMEELINVFPQVMMCNFSVQVCQRHSLPGLIALKTW